MNAFRVDASAVESLMSGIYTTIKEANCWGHKVCVILAQGTDLIHQKSVRYLRFIAKET